MKQFLTGCLMLTGICGLVLGPTSWSLAGPQSESMCTIGMVKGEKGTNMRSTDSRWLYHRQGPRI